MPPPLFRSRSRAAQLLLAGVAPAVTGTVAGLLLGVSHGAWLAAVLVAIAGGFLAGLEHDRLGGGALRGLVIGLIFGVFVLVGHELSGGETTDDLPDPEALQVPIAAVFSAGLGALGAFVRGRLAAREASP